MSYLKTKFQASEPRPIGTHAFEVTVTATRGNRLVLEKTYCLEVNELQVLMDGLDKLNNEAQTAQGNQPQRGANNVR